MKRKEKGTVPDDKIKDQFKLFYLSIHRTGMQIPPPSLLVQHPPKPLIS